MERIWNPNYLKAWSANFMLYFSFMILTPLLPLYLSEEFGASKDEIGMILSGYALTALLIRPFSGFLVDSFPARSYCSVAGFFFSSFLVDICWLVVCSRSSSSVLFMVPPWERLQYQTVQLQLMFFIPHEGLKELDTMDSATIWRQPSHLQ